MRSIFCNQAHFVSNYVVLLFLNIIQNVKKQKNKNIGYFLIVAVLSMTVNILSVTRAQAFDVNDGFNPSTNGSVFASAILNDGTILIGGDFTTVNTDIAYYVAKLYVNGTSDPHSFADINGIVRTIVVQADGKIIIAGDFTIVDGVLRNGIARFNHGGGLDKSFNPGAGADDAIFDIVLQPDGKIIVVGAFKSFDNHLANRIVRLNTDGSLDSEFKTGTGANDSIFTVALLNDSRIVIGGRFTHFDGIPQKYITRLSQNGYIEAMIAIGEGADSWINDISIQLDNKILVAGAFYYFDEKIMPHIARLYPDGKLDNTFIPSAGANDDIFNITLQHDGKLLITGGFTSYNHNPALYIARLNVDGTLDHSFDVGKGPNNDIYTIAIQSDDKILLGGSFSEFDDKVRSHAARLNLDGSLEETFESMHDDRGSIYVTTVQKDGKTLVGGAFNTIDDTPRFAIARFNQDGTLDTTFNPQIDTTNTHRLTDGTKYTDNPIINSIVVQPNGQIMIGGFFDLINGIPRKGLARLNSDGSLDQSFNARPTSRFSGDPIVFKIILQTNNDMVVYGGFTQIGGLSRARIARLDSRGNANSTFNANHLNLSATFIKGLLQQTDGKLVLALGNGRIVKLNTDGSLDAPSSSFVSMPSFYFLLPRISPIALQENGKLLIGKGRGGFRNEILRLMNDRSVDRSFNLTTMPDAYVSSVLPQVSGKSLIGGSFDSIDGHLRNNFAKLNNNGSLDFVLDPGTGFDRGIYALTQRADGRIISYGGFNYVNGVVRNSMAGISTKEAALQTFTVAPTGDYIEWCRTGSGPVLTWTTLETSQDGINWRFESYGKRLVNKYKFGWYFDRLNIPSRMNTYIRAHGYYITQEGQSGSIIESVRQVYLQ